MKISKRDILLLVGFIGFFSAGVTWYFLFQPTQEKVEAMRAENTRLEAQIKELTEKANNKEFYLSEMDRMQNEIEAIYQVFPVNVKAEDCIMLAINQELVAPMFVESVNIETVEMVDFSDHIDAQTEHEYTYDLGEGDVLGVGEEDAGVDTTAQVETTTQDSLDMLYNRQTTFNYAVSYEGLKRSIKHIVDQSNRVAIESLTVAFDDSTGLLAGSTTLNMYLVPYQEGKEYVEQNLSSVLLGTDNIFGTIVIHSEEDLPDVEDGQAQGAD